MTNNIVRRGFGLKNEITDKLTTDYKGNLVDILIASDNQLNLGSNTINLNNIATQYCPAYHISDAECIIDENSIRHKPVGVEDIVITKD